LKYLRFWKKVRDKTVKKDYIIKRRGYSEDFYKCLMKKRFEFDEDLMKI